MKNFDKKDLSRIIWMPKNLKKEIQNQLNPTVALNEKIENFCQMVSDEIVAKDAETVLIYAQKQNHPIFQ